MRDSTIEALKLFIEKANKLKSLDYVLKINEISFNWSANPSGEGKLTLNGPNSQEIDAFVLTFRFFIQENEPCSFRWISKHILSDPDLSENWKREFINVRKTINDTLDSHPSIQVVIAGNPPPTFRDIMMVFIYGDLSHTNPEKRRLFRLWASHPPTYGLLSTFFMKTLAGIYYGIVRISDLTEKELDLSSDVL